MCNLNFISGIGYRSKSLNRFSHPRNSIADFVTIFIPLILKHRIVVIVKMCRQGHFSTLTDSCLVSCDVNLGFTIDIYFKRFTHRCTTIGVCDFNSKGVRIIVRRKPVFCIDIVIYVTGNTASTYLIVFVPSIGNSSIVSTIYPGNQTDITITRSRVGSHKTYVVVTRNRNNRITFYSYSIGVNLVRFTSFNTEVDVSGVGIRGSIVIKNVELFVESRTINALHQDSILKPNIS